ncbi:MAG: hypothetical protein FJ086_20225 [Deltaproteobacteria bacterium]|nr:hypothetical protein [Deltaproteobacteria bacterium]
MAHAFRLKSQGKSWKDVLTGLQARLPQDLRLRGEAPEKGSKLQRAPLVLAFREGLSTRGVELLEGDGTLTLRLPGFPSREDLTLGLQLVELSAGLLGAQQVETVDGPVAPTALFSDEVAAALARAQSEENDALNTAVLLGRTLELPGCLRPFFLGPRTYESLRTTSTAQEGLWDKVVSAYRQVQWVHLHGIHPATVMGLRRGSSEFTASTWQPGKAHVFAPVDMVLVKAQGEPLRLPWAALPHVAADHFAWLDERQATVRGFTESEWPEVVSRAEAALGTRPAQ